MPHKNIIFATMISIKCYTLPSLMLVVCLFFGCAQVQTLQGGNVDTQAPFPVAIDPPNFTTFFDEQQIRITYDEFVRLNNPLQTISVIPNDLNILAELHGKTLTLKWDEKMREQTTYSIFLNRTVSDITESNDSIMQLVFSTGQTIDSLSYTTFVVNAETGQPEKDVVVGFFEHPDSLRPMYFAQTDETGKATLNYLKSGEYYLRAFSDELKQAKITKNDRKAFKENIVRPDTNLVDSVPLRMFSEEKTPKITTFEHKAPSLFFIATNRVMYDTLSSAKIFINQEEIEQKNVRIFSPDSIAIIYQPTDNHLIELIVESETWTDSARVRIPPTIRNKTTKWIADKTEILHGEWIQLATTDRIENIDTAQVEITNLSDSAIISHYAFEIDNNNVKFWIDQQEDERIKIKISNTATTISEGWNMEAFEQIFTYKTEKEFGVLQLTVENISNNMIVDVLQEGKLVRRVYAQTTDENQRFVFSQLPPGDYTFRIIDDENGNRQWDTGNFDAKVQPEKIYFFSTPTTIRANWEVEATIQVDPMH